jgi:hypothetical protein
MQTYEELIAINNMCIAVLKKEIVELEIKAKEARERKQKNDE